ncbi:alpha/beta-hydrolase [Rhodofomes roseus]|uniref:Alpha/beta-hydrolase n=1 Tax=Rhodofomes roseus TaxID=34475 RepID=A0ABQ8KD77_9APHY|nr:alpha/beta-hydrolase [Rhodofomes roseus]KAH9835600.1 alpha/beta-hydrolase [Rhodofomes roseus]
MTDMEHPFPVHHSIAALPPDSRIRQIYPDDLFPNGGYVQLPYGRTRYWLLGPEDGVKVVLIHGLSTPGVTWTRYGPYLAERGFRVLVYDLYGKGYSDAPKTAYIANIFVTQLALLLQYLKWEHAHIAGFSMGGGITAAFAATLPHLVSGKIVLMASAGVHEQGDPPPEPPKGPDGKPSPVSSPIPQYQELIKLQHELLPGYAEGVYSCLHGGPIHGLLWAFDKIAHTDAANGKQMEVLIVHGTLDPLVAYADALVIHRRIPHAQLVTIEGAGHDFPIHEKYWEAGVKSIAAFLST